MRKILLSALALVVASITIGTTLEGCSNETKHSDTLDTVVIPAKVVTEPADSNANVLTITGKVMDGAMNSVWVEVSPDSTIEFSYPQLDRNNSELFYNWSIDDKITIKYIKTATNGDSVISIQKAE